MHYLIIQLIVIGVAGAVGVWMFYIQHQFEDAYWEPHENWDYTAAALQGSSFYKLPRVLQWFSGNIGFHHVHHLSSRIPNYNLERCHNSHPIFQIGQAHHRSASASSPCSFASGTSSTRSSSATAACGRCAASKRPPPPGRRPTTMILRGKPARFAVLR